MIHKNTSQELAELSMRAKEVKFNPELRHIPNINDVRIVSENVRLMQTYQYDTIHQERSDA